MLGINAFHEEYGGFRLDECSSLSDDSSSALSDYESCFDYYASIPSFDSKSLSFKRNTSPIRIQTFFGLIYNCIYMNLRYAQLIFALGSNKT